MKCDPDNINLHENVSKFIGYYPVKLCAGMWKVDGHKCLLYDLISELYILLMVFYESK